MRRVLCLVLLGLVLTGCTGGHALSTPPALTSPTTPTATTASAASAALEQRGVAYGSNTTYAGKTVTLALDLFLPRTVGSGRPLLILLGRATQKYTVELGRRLAAAGIAVAFIDDTNYGSGPPGMNAGTWRTAKYIQDVKGAVRFFRKDAATENRYGIDPQRIVIGGHSAMGAITAIVTYLRDPAQADAAHRQAIAAAGGMEGTSNPGYDSSVAGWVGLAACIRLADLNWITASSPPMLVVYGTQDTGIPPGTREYTMLAEQAVWGGAITQYARAKAVGLAGSKIYPIEGGDHMSAIEPANHALIDQLAGFVKAVG